MNALKTNIGLALVLALAVTYASTACAPAPPGPTASPLLVIGIDGLEWAGRQK